MRCANEMVLKWPKRSSRVYLCGCGFVIKWNGARLYKKIEIMRKGFVNLLIALLAINDLRHTHSRRPPILELLWFSHEQKNYTNCLIIAITVPFAQKVLLSK